VLLVPVKKITTKSALSIICLISRSCTRWIGSAQVKNAEILGVQIAEQLLAQGADQILQAIYS